MGIFLFGVTKKKKKKAGWIEEGSQTFRILEAGTVMLFDFI